MLSIHSIRAMDTSAILATTTECTYLTFSIVIFIRTTKELKCLLISPWKLNHSWVTVNIFSKLKGNNTLVETATNGVGLAIVLRAFDRVWETIKHPKDCAQECTPYYSNYSWQNFLYLFQLSRVLIFFELEFFTTWEFFLLFCFQYTGEVIISILSWHNRLQCWNRYSGRRFSGQVGHLSRGSLFSYFQFVLIDEDRLQTRFFHCRA